MLDQTLFRAEALDSLRRPEQVGRALLLVRPPYRLSLIGLGMLLVVAVVGSGLVQVPLHTAGTGVVLHASATLESTVAAQHEGLLTAVAVKRDDVVRPGDLIATVRQPGLEQDLRLAQDEQAFAQQRHDSVLALQESSRQRLGPLHQHMTQEATDSIARLLVRQGELTKLVGELAALRSNGTITVDRYLNLRAQLSETQDAIAAKRASLLQTQLDWTEKQNQYAREHTEVEERLAQAGRQVRRLSAQVEAASSIRATQGGTVSEVKVSPGDLVRFNSPIVGLMPTGANGANTLVAIGLIPAVDGKKLAPGMRAFVDPSNVRRDVYGQIKGRVTAVSPTPATPDLLRNLLRNEELVRKATESGPVFFATIAMEQDPGTPSGFAWTSSQGPDGRLTLGTPLRVEIETETVNLLGLLMPALRQTLRGEVK